GAGNSRSGLIRSGLEATVKVYGVTVGDVAGVKPGASPVDRTAVNVGTVRVVSTRLPRPEGLGGGQPRTRGRAAACPSGRESNVRRCAGEYRRRVLAGSIYGWDHGPEDADQTA